MSYLTVMTHTGCKQFMHQRPSSGVRLIWLSKQSEAGISMGLLWPSTFRIMVDYTELVLKYKITNVAFIALYVM